MKIIIDMNLSPEWIPLFDEQGWTAYHWSTIGDPRAPDHIIMQWARSNGCIVFTHDLDFGTILATTQAERPSVIQVRTEDVTPYHLQAIVINALRTHQELLEARALLVIDEHKLRIRILPLTLN